jgi:hypothetical protein
MATLTIKPTAAGNDVQIKSGDGNTTHATFGDTNNISMSTGSIASAVTGTLGSGIVFPAGHVLQVKSILMTDTDSTTSTTDGGVVISGGSDLSIAITPADANNKVLLTAMITCANSTGGKRNFFMFNGGNSGVKGDAATGHECLTVVNAFTGAGSEENVVMQYLDSPATASETTYSVYWWVEGGTGWINRAATQDAYQGNGTSTFTVMEISV